MRHVKKVTKPAYADDDWVWYLGSFGAIFSGALLGTKKGQPV